MYPIRDHNPSGRTPFVTYTLISMNIILFISYLGLFNDPRAIDTFYRQWGILPAQISAGYGYETLVTSMFLHGGYMHILGNMLFLWIFGDNMEDEMGHLGFLLFYVAAGIAAGLIHVMFQPDSLVPTVGASGAIAGVMGGYLLLFPRAKVDILLIFIIFFKVFTIPAWIMLALWFAIQLFLGVTADPSTGGVAYWAHAGGFVAGLILTFPVFVRKGGKAFWSQNHGAPPHPETEYTPSHIPRVKRK
ncbi:MAG: rhomboid family intramembrane serine protease [Rhodobacterales bacterium]|nr:MAG: rhomboid family intramembrane serine protease [Rhodobacterales bacterium]